MSYTPPASWQAYLISRPSPHDCSETTPSLSQGKPGRENRVHYWELPTYRGEEGTTLKTTACPEAGK